MDALSELSQLALDNKEKEELEREIRELIKSTSIINEIDTGDIDPIINIHPIKNVVRADIIEESLDVEEVLFNAPSREDDYILVPKIRE